MDLYTPDSSYNKYNRIIFYLYSFWPSATHYVFFKLSDLIYYIRNKEGMS